MRGYLDGFNDGYKKAMEQMDISKNEILIDGRALAKSIYKDITELQKQDEERAHTFR